MTSFNLSDGFPVCSDFTAAAVIRNPDRLREIRAGIEALDGEQEPLTKESLNAALVSKTGANRGLSSAEFNAVMASLTNTSAATESRTTPEGYSEYTFSVAPDEAARVLDQQLVASISVPFLAPPDDSRMDVRLVATLPREVEENLARDIGRLNISLRRLIMDASESVRIANPFFDPEQRIVKDLAALPSREIEVRLLTREVKGEHADGKTLDAVVELVRELDEDSLNHVNVRDFYETNTSGQQTGAVHAKIVSVDEDRCYIGSANLTELNLQGNFELGVLLEGDLVSEVNAVFDAMFNRADSVPL